MYCKKCNQVALYKRAPWANWSVKRQHEWFAHDLYVFCMFWQFSLFFPFLRQSLTYSRHSSLFCSFFKWDGSNSLRLLKTKEWLWAICSRDSGQNSDLAWLAQVAQDKRAKEQITCFFVSESFCHPYTHQRQVICSKNPWENFQQCHTLFQFNSILNTDWPSLIYCRVGHRILLRSECNVLLRSFKECIVLLRSFFKFFASYETQKNIAFFCILLKRTHAQPSFFFSIYI